MSARNFEECLALTLKYEGGFVNDPHDPGGATNYGITIGTLSEFLGRNVTVESVQNMPLSLAKQIYRRNYWDKVRGDELPSGVDHAVWDFAVNSGVTRGIIGLQRALGVADDGKIGPVTIRTAALRESATVVHLICQGRLQMLRRLSTWPRYGKGWSSRVKAVEKAALAMIERKDMA